MHSNGSVDRERSKLRLAPPTQATQLGPIAPITRPHGDRAKETFGTGGHRGMHLPIHAKVKFGTPSTSQGQPNPPERYLVAVQERKSAP